MQHSGEQAAQSSTRQMIPLLLAVLALGLFGGRLLGESVRPSLAGAVLLTLLALSLAVLVVFAVNRRGYFHTSRLLALLPLLFYLFYPFPDPRVALAAAGVTLLTLCLTFYSPTEETSALTSPLIIPPLIFISFLVLYVLTLAPGVLPADSGELQVVAATLGVAHPPGFPLYTMLAHLLSRLPLGPSAAYRVNLFSALTSAATVTLVYLGGYHLTRRFSPGLLAAFALGTATTFWAQATTANVRSLTAFFAALALYSLLRLATNGKREKQPLSDYGWLILLVLALSLGVTHHPSLAFMALLFVLVLPLLQPQWPVTWRNWLWLILAALLGLLPLLYLPLRASAVVRGASPALATLPGFLDHILARGFSGDFFYFIEPTVLWLRLQIMVNVMAFQFHPLLLAGMASGLLLLLWTNWRLALLLGGSFAVHTVVTATYRAPQTVEYMLPAYVPAVLCLAYLLNFVQGLPGVLKERGRPWLSALYPLAAAVLLAVTIGQGVSRFQSYQMLQSDSYLSDYTNDILSGAPAGSLVLADWHWATPLWYLQEVENRRPDLSIQYVFPTEEAYAETWRRRINEGRNMGQAIVATHYDSDPATAFAALPPPEPLGQAFLFSTTPRTTLPAGFLPLDLVLGGSIQLLGYQLGQDTVAPVSAADLTLAWQPVSTLDTPLSLFAHLVGADGALYAQQDQPARAQPEGITLTRFSLVPRPGAAMGLSTVMVGAYQSMTGEPLTNAEGAARIPLTSLAINAMDYPLYTENPVYLPLTDPETILTGYDWDTTLPNRPRLYLHWRTPAGYEVEVRDTSALSVALPPAFGPWGLSRQPELTLRPAHYVPFAQGIVWLGHPLLPAAGESEQFYLPQQFAASQPLQQDLVVSVRLIGYETGSELWDWWVLDDSVPALGAIPTLKWIGGSRVWDPHLVLVHQEAYPGQRVGALLRLYNAFSTEPVPILDERINQEFLGIPLGTVEVGQ